MAGARLETSSDALAEVQDAHPRWAIWVSSAGRYWATRRGKIKIPEKLHRGWSMTIDADSIPELEKKIDEQEECD